MNPEIKSQWVAALRSGDYRQGTGYLRRLDNTFCCLGVLCDLAVKAGAIQEPVLNFTGSYDYGPVRVSANPPSEVIAWAEGIGNFSLSDLIDMNDSGDYSFDQIADYIESHL